MSQFFGVERSTYDPGDLVSSEFLAVKLGNGASLTLVQQFALNYGRDITPVVGVGTPGVYFLTGRAQGTLDVSRAVTKGVNILNDFRGSECGTFTAISVSGIGAGACSMASPETAITADRAMLQSVSLNASSGNLLLTDGARYVLTDLDA